MIYRFDDFTIDTDLFEIRRRGEQLSAEPKVLDLLFLLIENHERVLSRDELLERVWEGRIVSDTTLSTCIKSARQLLGDSGTEQKYIRTIHGRGFRFNVKPTAVGGQPAQSGSSPRPQTRYAKSGEVHIAYQIFGDGPINLVLAPGFVSHIDNYWDHPGVVRWLEDLGSFARVVIFDKRGTGLSDQVPDMPGVDERMDDVRAVMDAVGFERAAIMGISEGGSLAMIFAASHPGRCEALIVYGGFAKFSSWIPTAEGLQELFDYIETHWGTGISLPNFAPGEANDPVSMNWWGKFERLGANPGAAKALMLMNSKIDLTHTLSSIRVPTLIIHRNEDVLIDLEGGLTLAERIPGAKYVELSGADHVPFFGENALEITGAVRDFLDNPPEALPSRTVLATIVVIADAQSRTTVTSAGLHDLSSVIRRHRGGDPVISGDLVVADFDGPGRALRCASAMVSSSRRSAQPMRMGVHTGIVDIGPGVIDGQAVKVAMGMARAAKPNEVLVSRTVSDLVAGSGVELREVPPRMVDDMPEDWSLYAISS